MCSQPDLRQKRCHSKRSHRRVHPWKDREGCHTVVRVSILLYAAYMGFSSCQPPQDDVVPASIIVTLEELPPPVSRCRTVGNRFVVEKCLRAIAEDGIHLCSRREVRTVAVRNSPPFLACLGLEFAAEFVHGTTLYHSMDDRRPCPHRSLSIRIPFGACAWCTPVSMYMMY